MVAIIFTPNEENELSARIDNLEVGFFAYGGCYILIRDKKTDEENDTTIMTRGEGTREELEAKIRAMFKTGTNGSGHRQNWPQPAARIFANAVWEFDE